MTPPPRPRFSAFIEQAPRLYLWLVIQLVICLRFYHRHIEGYLRGILLPNRRQQSLPVFIADEERRRPPLHPIQLVLPVTAAQIAVFIFSLLIGERAIFPAGILNLIIAAAAMLPSFRARPV